MGDGTTDGTADGPGGRAEDGAGGAGGGGADGGGENARARRILTEISPRTWEHPSDRAALAALRKIPVFDQVLRKLFGFFGEKPVRLAFQANAVRVSEEQFPEVHRIWQEVLRTLDSSEQYELLVTQTPIVNAGAYGMERPFVILNSGTLRLLDDEQLRYVLGHELGHILSGHVLYRTMMTLLMMLAHRNFPIVGWAAWGVLVALLEWYRKSELSCDRAGLLAVQDPEPVMHAMLRMAGGGRDDETDLDAFVRQAEEYRSSGDVADSVFKVLNLLGTTHPFYVLRLAEIRSWIEEGEYDRVLRGEYPRRGEADPAYQEDLRAAANAYAEGARDFTRDFTEELAGAARRMRDTFMGGFGGR